MFDKLNLKFPPPPVEKSDATDLELDAMRKIEAALAPLTKDEQARVIRSMMILYGVTPPTVAVTPTPPLLQARRDPAPAPTNYLTRRWGLRRNRRPPRARHCKGCGEVGHDRRNCPLDFEITVET